MDMELITTHPIKKSDLGFHDKKLDIFNQVWKQHEDEYSIDFDVDRLIPIFEKEHGITLPKNYSFVSDFVNRFEPNPSIWPVIEKIHKTKKIGLLTNVYPRMLDGIKQRNIMPQVAWDVEIDSSIVGLKKPHRKIFELAQDLAKVNRDEMLFVDNTPGHIKAAADFGWQTFLYDSKDPVQSSKKLLQIFGA